jgi:hypothetical protein
MTTLLKKRKVWEILTQKRETTEILKNQLRKRIQRQQNDRTEIDLVNNI